MLDGKACVLQTDFGYFGPPEEHLQWTQEEREATYITPEDPSSEICGEVAAAFAASSLALKDTGKNKTMPSPSDTPAFSRPSPQSTSQKIPRANASAESSLLHLLRQSWPSRTQT